MYRTTNYKLQTTNYKLQTTNKPINMPCGICKQAGHNSRTCKSELAMPDLFDKLTVDRFELPVDWDVSFNNANFPFEKEELDDKNENEECMVCYEKVSTEKVTIKCGHTYCVECFVKHMRTQGTCAYCRADVCKPPVKASLAPDMRASIMDQWLENSQDLSAMIREEFIRQMRDNLARDVRLIRTETAEMIENLCIGAASNTNLTFGLWMAGVRASEYTSYWYESDM